MANISTDNINTLAQLASSLDDGDYIYVFKNGASAFSRIEKSVFMQGMSGGDDGESSDTSVSLVDDGTTISLTVSNNTPIITVNPSALIIGGGSTTATFVVSGTNLKSSIQLTASNGFSVSPSTIGKSAGATTVTVTYTGSAETATGTITAASNGAQSQTVGVTYTESQVPTISASENSLSFSAGAGESVTQTFTVTGVNLEGNISVAVSGSKFSVSPSTIQQSGGVASATVTVTYSPSQSDTGSHTGTITLSSTGATSKTISLSGSVVAKSLTITPSTLSLESATGSAASGTIIVKGENLTSAVTLASSSADFELSTNSISAADINAAGTTGVAVTVTRKASASATTTSITATSGSLSASASVQWTEAVVEETPSEGDTIVKAGIYYKVLSSASGSTPGTLMLINPDGDNSTTKSSYIGNFVVPSEIIYAQDNYTVVKIGQRAFINSEISSVNIPSSVNEIQRSAFYGSKLTSVAFNEDSPNDSINIGDKAFQDSDLSGTLLLPSSCKSCGTLSFQGTDITKLEIGEAGSNEAESLSLRDAFNGLTLTKIVIHKITPPTAGDNANFSTATKNNAKVYVPYGYVETYKSKLPWSEFTQSNILSINDMPAED